MFSLGTAPCYLLFMLPWATIDDVIVSQAGNLIRGPYHYGIDLDAMASHSIIASNDVRESLYSALFIEMQCLHNVVTSNTFRAGGRTDGSASYARAKISLSNQESARGH